MHADDPKHGDEREVPVRLIMSQAHAARARIFRSLCGHAMKRPADLFRGLRACFEVWSVSFITL
jgi:hypothetical protein